MLKINRDAYRSTESTDGRIRFLVLHYTAQNFQESIISLTSNRASAHYLVIDPDDPSYLAAGFSGMQIFNLVDEQQRAWHAGESYWQGRTMLNDTSIGIEIVNGATDDNGIFTFPPYSDVQIESLIALIKMILARYADISPTRIVGHSDIAIERKSDPGAAFPWERLAESGIGAWYDKKTQQQYYQRYLKDGVPTKQMLLHLFAIYGYDVRAAQNDEGFAALVRAFQLHFRPSCYDGVCDEVTASILTALVEKYCLTDA